MSALSDATRESGRGRWREARLLAGCAAALVPWIVVLALTLPARAVASNWSIAWQGFDLLLAVMLALTAWLRHRGDPRVRALAGASAAMLVVDAWFDTCTASMGFDFVMACFSALFVELPLAIVCGRIALRAGR